MRAILLAAGRGSRLQQAFEQPKCLLTFGGPETLLIPPRGGRGARVGLRRALDEGVDAILEAIRGQPHIFNLGHGITPDTPVAHVERLVARVRAPNR